jgi:hypothetical protein
MTVTTRRERRQQQRRQQQRHSGGGGGGGSRGISQVWIVAAVVIAVTALILIGRAAGVFEPPAASLDPNASQFDPAGQSIGTHQDSIGAGHVPSAQKVAYPSLPPTSGDHWSQQGVAPAPWGVKTALLPFEVTTHNLEHGGIVILYASDLPPDQVAALQSLVRQLMGTGFPKEILEPWPDMPKDSKVILTSWNWILKLASAEQAQIVKFVRAHHASSEAPEPTVP